MTRERESVDIKQEIKDAVNESLIDAITTANGRSSNRVVNVLLMVLQIIVVPLIGWLLWTSVDIQKDIVLMRYQLQEVNINLEEHMENNEAARSAAIVLHHSLVGTPVCSECHDVATSTIFNKNPRIKKNRDDN